MTTKNARDILQSLELFKSLVPEALDRLTERTTEVNVRAGVTLVKQGEPGDHMFVLVSGALSVWVNAADGSRSLVGRIEPGYPVGEMQVVLGGTRTADVVADVDCALLGLPKSAIDDLAENSAQSFATLTSIVSRRLRRLQLAAVLRGMVGNVEAEVLKEFEANIEWVTIRRGEALFRQGEKPDAWYIVVSGRLQVVHNDTRGADKVLGEVGRGESVGEMALLSNEPRSATLYAVRDTELIKVTRDEFNRIMLRYPAVLMGITQTLVKRLSSSSSATRAPRRSVTIAVVPAHKGVAVDEFAVALARSLGHMGATLHLSVDRLHQMGVVRNAARVPDDHPQWQRYGVWLEERAEQHPFVVLEADREPTSWTRRCIGSADHVVVVADADGEQAPGEVENLLYAQDADAHSARRTLVLVHPHHRRLPSGTRAWLTRRRVNAHLHVRQGDGADMDRVARLITGRGVGLALGGGGARGFAHIGVFKAMKELGVPVDYIGGTSMGAIMACQYAMGPTIEEMLVLNRRIAATKPFTEYTIPMVALLTSHGIDNSARMAFADVEMEDTWIPCFAVSSNLTTAEMVVHDSGPLWKATRASGSLPGIVIPVIQGEHLLVDGGVINNMPGDVMRTRCGGPVICVNVSPEEELPVPRDGIPPQWTIFWNRVLPGRRPLDVPNIVDILMRTMMIGSAQRTHQVARAADLYLAPPIERFGMLAFESMEDIVDTSYRHAMEKMVGFKWTD